MPSSAEQLEREFAARGTRRGGLLLLESTSALDLIARARDEMVTVLGIDGFSLTPNGTQPHSEHSLDLSGARNKSVDSWSLAENFIRERQDSPLHFEIVLE